MHIAQPASCSGGQLKLLTLFLISSQMTLHASLQLLGFVNVWALQQ